MKQLLALLFFVFSGVLMSSALPQYYTTTLTNGLEVVAIPLRANNVITTDVFYKVGSGNEQLGKSGIAHMLEHMNFKSTKNLKTGQFDEIVKGYGGVNNASTSFDYTHYFINSSADNLPKSLELFAELMQNLLLKDEEFQPERQVVAEERRWRTDNTPMGLLYFNLFNTAYIYHPYHWSPIGFMEDIQSWNIDDIKSFHAAYYQPKNAIVIVAGDVTPEKVFSEAKAKFESIPNCCELPKRHMVEPEQNGAKRLVVHKNSEVDMLAIAYKIPSYDNEDMVALSALSELLSSGKSSRLVKTIADKKRLANSIYAYNMDLKDPGLFMFMAVCNSGVKAETVEKEILLEIERIKQKGISKEEMAKLKVNTKADFIFSLESSSHVADLFGTYFARGSVKPLLEYEEKLTALSAKDLQEVAKKYFNAKSSTTVILTKDEVEKQASKVK